MYAVWHGPAGLAAIARRVHGHAAALADALRAGGVEVDHEPSSTPSRPAVPGPGRRGPRGRARPGHQPLAGRRRPRVGQRRRDHRPARPRGGAGGLRRRPAPPTRRVAGRAPAWPQRWCAPRDYLTHPVFHSHHSETAMLRYLRRLADRDFALDRGMIPLGSCTMKLNATTEMEASPGPSSPTCTRSPRPTQTEGIRDAHRRPVELAVRDHRLRRGVAAAQRRLAGRVRRAAGHPRLPPGPRRSGSATSA